MRNRRMYVRNRYYKSAVVGQKTKEMVQCCTYLYYLVILNIPNLAPLCTNTNK